MSHATPYVPPDPEELAPFFPNYVINGLIACGGMGAVYHAHQLSLDRDVAVKILRLEFSGNAGFRANFTAEAKAMAKLNHPNLVSVYDFGGTDGMLYIIMEYVPGESLYARTFGKAVELQEICEIMQQVCAGLGHAHQHGIIHRDIKPANILLDVNGNPKIGDFGLASRIGLVAKPDETIFGTPDYTAPEVIHSPDAVDARSDIFSMGVVLHELLTGKLPSADKRPPSVISGCPAGFDAIVKRATDPNPAARYPDVASMERDLAAMAGTLRKPLAGMGGRVPHQPRQPRLPHVARQAAPSRQARKAVSKGAPRVAARGPSPGTAGRSGKIARGGIAAVGLLAVAWGVYMLAESNRGVPPGKVPAASVPVAPVANPPVADAKPAGKIDPASLGPNEFLDQARGGLRRKSAPAIAYRDEALKQNLENFSLRVRSQAGAIKEQRVRNDSEMLVQAKIGQWKRSGNRLPATGAAELNKIPGALDTLELFLGEQRKIDADFKKKIRESVVGYVKDIELQISRMDPKIDNWAIARLQAEIRDTQQEPDHIFKILGEAP